MVVVVRLNVHSDPVRIETAEAASGLTCAGGHVDITPPVPLQLAGYGDCRRVWDRIADPLEANVLLLKHPSGQALFLQLDVISAGDRLRRELLARFSGRLADEELVLVASHTHSAPCIDGKLLGLAGEINEDYMCSVIEKVGGLLDRVLAETQPVYAAYGEANADHSINRRAWCLKPSGPLILPVRRTMALHPNPRGPKDETVRGLSFWRDAARTEPAGILWNYTCHPVGFPHLCRVSADYPGAVRRRLRTLFRPEMPVVFLPGFSGNVRPNRVTRWPLSLYYGLHRIVNGPVFGKFSDRGWAKWTTTLGDVAAAAMADHTRPAEISAIRSRRLAHPLQDLMDGTVDDREISYHRVSLEGVCLLVGISAEVVVEYAAELRRMCPGMPLLAMGYLDGVCGYLPVSSMLTEGGLEVDSPGYSLSQGRYREDLSVKVLQSLRTVMSDGAELP